MQLKVIGCTKISEMVQFLYENLKQVFELFGLHTTNYTEFLN